MKTKHQKLIKLLYDNDELIDKIYKNPNSVHSSNIPPNLLEQGIILKLGEAVDLNPFYRQFVNTILLKADYSILFGNFDEHSKEIISLKKRYLETNDYGLIIKIKNLIHSLYMSVELQNKQIEALLYSMENQINIELDQLIHEASSLHDKVESYLTSIKNILRDLDDDLASINSEIEESVDTTNYTLEPYLSKIESYCDRFSDLIRISEEKKALNQKLFSLRAMILQNNDDYLVDFLIENQDNIAFTLDERIIFVPNEEIDLTKMTNLLKSVLSIPKPKIRKTITKKVSTTRNIIYIDEEKIINDLEENGCDDLYTFLLKHPEIKKLESSKQDVEAFRIFMLFCINKEYPLLKSIDFNSSNIRRVSWH